MRAPQICGGQARVHGDTYHTGPARRFDTQWSVLDNPAIFRLYLKNFGRAQIRFRMRLAARRHIAGNNTFEPFAQGRGQDPHDFFSRGAGNKPQFVPGLFQ
jgi:hypothetical protein